MDKFKQSLQSGTILEKTWKHLKTLALTQLAFALDGESSALLGGVIFKSPATTAQGSVHVPCNFTMFHKHATQQRSPGKTARRHVEPPVAKRCPYYAFHIGSNWRLLKKQGKDRVRGGKCVIHLHGLHQSGCLIPSPYCFRPRPKDTWYFGCGFKLRFGPDQLVPATLQNPGKNGTNVYSWARTTLPVERVLASRKFIQVSQTNGRILRLSVSNASSKCVAT